MCKLIRKTKRKSFTGYKAVRKINGKYYSYWTGVKYRVGPVKGTKKPLTNASPFSSFILDPGGSCNQPDYFGKTGAFKKKTDAKGEVERYNRYGNSACVLAVRLGGEIWHVDNGGDAVIFAGTVIDSMEEVK